MSHAERCPVCHGSGKIWKGVGTSSTGYEDSCYGCNGKGWVSVE